MKSNANLNTVNHSFEPRATLETRSFKPHGGTASPTTVPVLVSGVSIPQPASPPTQTGQPKTQQANH